MTTLQKHQSNAAKARAIKLTSERRKEIAAMGGLAKAAKHQDRNSFKKWSQKGQRTMTATKERIEKRKATSKHMHAYRVGINNTKGDPHQLSPRFAKHA